MRHRVHTVCLCLALFVMTLCGRVSYAEDSTSALDRDLEAQWNTQQLPAHDGDRLFKTAQRFELALNLGVIGTDDYFNYVPITLDVHYRFTEMWGAMFAMSVLAMHTDTKLSDFMAKHQDKVDVKLLGDEQMVDFELLGTFHPVYGKMTYQAANMPRFDWGIFAGIGVVVSKSANKMRTKRETQGHAEGVIGTDFHIFFLDWLALRLEASMRFYHAPTQWVIPCTLSAGVSFLLPSLDY